MAKAFIFAILSAVLVEAEPEVFQSQFIAIRELIGEAETFKQELFTQEEIDQIS
jgi:hypothetical protein